MTLGEVNRANCEHIVKQQNVNNYFLLGYAKKFSESCISRASKQPEVSVDRVSQNWPRLIHGEASDTVSCRCPSRLHVCVRFGSGKRRPTTVSEHHRF
ncbi:hypothetical protein DEO72_LG8g1712 [Vigna unguiculata]|uniref:Uncharacterized protein n=1 Tax=Vigna unguiculata TaxID=3917 RepID=A0A4D6MUW1_VIGUN|nr:hypothetical protein DEO72_LG8g1712 [Vigna unguiculata]